MLRQRCLGGREFRTVTRGPPPLPTGSGGGRRASPPSKVEGGRVNAQAEALPPPHHANANARVAMATTMPAVVKAGGSHDRLAA